MRIPPGLFGLALGAIVVGTLVASGAGGGLDLLPAVDAQSTPPGPAGVWRTTGAPAAGQSLPGVIVLAADGHASYTGLPVQPAASTAPNRLIYSSPGQGVWAATGNGTIALELVVVQADENGEYIGTTTLRGTGQVSADGQTLDGNGVSTTADPAGNVLSTVPFSARSSRMTVGAPASSLTGFPFLRP